MFDPSIEILPAHLRHAQVTENDMVAVSGEQFEGAPAVGHTINMVAGPPKREVKQLPGVWIVFHH
jgi:hypothetical protein